MPAGHPRVGGERNLRKYMPIPQAGPSPRGRGTPLTIRPRQLPGRAIPAWAGNARASKKCSAQISGHPRVGGERSEVTFPQALLSGPSPRGRGTLLFFLRYSGDFRAIPAWAGNACTAPSSRSAASGHPRVGGERKDVGGSLLSAHGPSPRGRGTLRRSVGVAGAGRAIPAWAGNACTCATIAHSIAGHPRVGGERSRRACEDVLEGGPSPRGRGTPRRSARPPPRRRAIPAWAGNARERILRPRRRSGHPRVGGERYRTNNWVHGTGGPSPRGRGTRSRLGDGPRRRRAIPAWAGNASKSSSPTGR